MEEKKEEKKEVKRMKRKQGLFWGDKRSIPEISCWRFDKNSWTVSGIIRCWFNPEIRDGSQFTTSPVIDPSAVNQYALIETESGSWYRLEDEDKPDRISNWRVDKNRGTVSGTVIGDRAIRRDRAKNTGSDRAKRDGSQFTTSRLKDPSTASQFTIVRTESGWEYELLNAADAPSRCTSNMEKQGFDHLEQHPELLPDLQFVGFGGTWAAFLAAKRESERLPKHINSDYLLAEAVRIRTIAKGKTNSKQPIRSIIRDLAPSYAVGRLAEKNAGKFELLDEMQFTYYAYDHKNNKIDYLKVLPSGVISCRKIKGHWPGPFLRKGLFRGEMREFRSPGKSHRCFIIEGVFFLWPLVPTGYLCPRRPNNKWHEQGMYTKGEALCYILSLPKQSSQRRIFMEFLVQNNLVPVARARLYKLVKDHESGSQVRGDDWDSNEGPPFQMLTSGIPGHILNGDYYAEVASCNKTKKVIRGCAKLEGRKGWKAQLKFPVNEMWKDEVSENPVVYDIVWQTEHRIYQRFMKQLSFPKDIKTHGTFKDVCELFQNKKNIERAYFQGFYPPGYGNRYSFDKVKEYIICQSIVCGSPVNCFLSKDLKSGTQKIFRCTKKCADGKRCPFGFVLKCDFRGYYIDCQSSQCCKWHLCD